ncbi:VOC family protein [Macrococcoides caseolyticum]|uniref:VOC family protein n=1 Tax=Macrococcoides caseolyticum TaxID=69966 RepID=UPI001F3B75E7|nr:VOC family protein [Macrococcus caseolyticus]MCE4957279.1 VOC family protein [Macrococcus caseolyticus]
MRKIIGQHHASGITKDAAENLVFYAEILGMRLVKKTVNQDDPSMYHLFYADATGSPGTDITFFEIPSVGHTYHGTNSITQIALRVKSDEAVKYFEKRFNQFNVKHSGAVVINGRLSIEFEDFEGQRLAIVSDVNNHGVASGSPWEKSSVPVEYGITGLGPFKMDVEDIEGFRTVLTEIFGYQLIGSFIHPLTHQEIYTLSADLGGTGDELQIVHNTNAPERPGKGSMHHIALRVKDEAELQEWVQYLNALKLPTSGFVDRHFFKSLYIRTRQGILIELATDGPGFHVNEPLETLGESLSLPPFLEEKREWIESQIKPLPPVKQIK